ncbi:signal peptide protein [Streptomyces kaniharaensis]|uniref:Signal peptide protein n=1 Tax=Streptomyces kaniharaensis TaxID=212423 RepID=A0A6N7KXT1_9ACTN|nr:signal peptide protein [Streptomyces kaniharaensis]
MVTSSSAAPVGFVNLHSRPLPTDHAAHRFTVTYRNNSSADRTIAPQILIESPAKGPFLDPSDIRLERLGTDGRWHVVPLASQTGTLFTSLIPAKLVLHSHHTLTQHYRITVIKAAHGTIEPRIALYA